MDSAGTFFFLGFSHLCLHQTGHSSGFVPTTEPFALSLHGFISTQYCFPLLSLNPCELQPNPQPMES